MKKTGFTLVEILIVTITLAILAAIAIPQFSTASIISKESTLKSDLVTLRNQLNLYRVQHGDRYPWEVVAPSSENMVKQLIGRTNDAGECMGASDDPSEYKFGPYLQKIPINPFVQHAGGDGAAFEFGTGPPTSSSGTGGGWYVDTENGKVYAHSSTAEFPDHVKF